MSINIFGDDIDDKLQLSHIGTISYKNNKIETNTAVKEYYRISFDIE